MWVAKPEVLSCLQPSSIRGWSLHGQVYSTFFCLSYSSIGFQMAFRSMLSIHCILGFLCLLAPGVVPCIISFSRQSPSFLITCPKYDNFLLFIMLSSPPSIPTVSNTHSFVFFCVQDTLRILRIHLISNASILRSFRFSNGPTFTPICSHRPYQSFHKSHFGGYLYTMT